MLAFCVYVFDAPLVAGYSMNPGNEGIFWGKMIVGVSSNAIIRFCVDLVIAIWWPMHTCKTPKKQPENIK